MDLKEILSRKSPSYYSIEECIYVVEKFIQQTKNVYVSINIYKNVDLNYLNHPVVKTMLSRELHLLNNAFLIASDKIKT